MRSPSGRRVVERDARTRARPARAREPRTKAPPAQQYAHRLGAVTPFERPATWPELHLMQGTPPPPDRLVTSDNWIEGPFNRWGFLHVRELARTARIAAGRRPVAPNCRPTRATSDRRRGHVRGRDGPARRRARAHLHRRDLRRPRRAHRVRALRRRHAPDDTHLLMSVSKSLTATLIGVLAGEGVLDPDATSSPTTSPHCAGRRGRDARSSTCSTCARARASTRRTTRTPTATAC